MRIATDWLDLEKIARSGQCFRWKKNAETYSVSAFGRVLTIRQVVGAVEADCAEAEWLDVWSKYFDMGTDYAAFACAADPGDKYLTEAVYAARGLRVLNQDLWETTVSFIVSQNNNIPRITGILNRLCDTCGGFPDPAGLLEAGSEALDRCGLGYRQDYLVRAAEKFLSDSPESFLRGYDYKSAQAYLMEYRGIGPKVADCICLYALGLRDAFPRDVWVRRIERDHYGGRFPAERYAGFAGIMQLFMFWYERTRQNLLTRSKSAHPDDQRNEDQAEHDCKHSLYDLRAPSDSKPRTQQIACN